MIRPRRQLHWLQDNYYWDEVPFLIRWPFRIARFAGLTRTRVLGEDTQLVFEAYWP